MLKSIAKAIAVTGILMIPAIAFAGSSAVATTNLNLRSGPGAKHQRVDTIPQGKQVQVQSCLQGSSWCKVTWHGHTGWASAKYLTDSATTASVATSPAPRKVTPTPDAAATMFKPDLGDHNRGDDPASSVTASPSTASAKSGASKGSHGKH